MQSARSCMQPRKRTGSNTDLSAQHIYCLGLCETRSSRPLNPSHSSERIWSRCERSVEALGEQSPFARVRPSITYHRSVTGPEVIAIHGAKRNVEDLHW